MVTRIQKTVFDDLDQSTEGVHTYRFALEGIEYEIDLSDPNLDKLRAALRPFVAGGRRLPKHKTVAAGTGNGVPGKKVGAVRQWWSAHQNDFDLPPYNPRGAIPSGVTAAMREAQES